MSVNIEMNVMGTDNQYQIVYPQTTTDNVIGLNTELSNLESQFNQALINYFTKDQTLQDSTATMFGLNVNAIPDDVFAYLGKYAQHWWRRRTFTYAPILAAAGEIVITQSSSKDLAADVPYSSELSITSLTEFDLKSPTNLSLSYSTYTKGNTLKGKYFRTHKFFGGEVISEDIFYMAPDASNVNRNRETVYSVIGTAAKVSIATQYGEDYEYVRSSDRDAYPDSGKQDGYEYQYLGVPFDNAVGAPKIETGSYVGTGTYGWNNKNSLTFEFEPKIVFLTLGDSFSIYGFFVFGASQFCTTSNYGGPFTITESTLSWYSNESATAQFNTNARKYYYIAIG